MTKIDLDNYIKDFQKHNIKPLVLILKRGMHFSNGVNTTDRKAFGQIPWIEYYRAFTDHDVTTFRCAGCGKYISVDDDVIDMNDDIEEAVGGHLLVGSPKGVSYYIVPLCKSCNNIDNSSIRIISDIQAVEEVGQSVINNDNGTDSALQAENVRARN